MRESDMQFVRRIAVIVRSHLRNADNSPSQVALESQVKELLKRLPEKGLSILTSGGFVGGKGFDELAQAITENIKSGYNPDKFGNLAREFTPTPDDIVLEKMRLERQNKVNPLSKTKSGIPHKHFEDKMVATTEDFTASVDKQVGQSTGYQASRKRDSHKFMLKHGLKNEKDIKTSKQGDDRIDLIGEFLMSLLFKRFLFDRAPVIELVNGQGESIENPKTKVVTFKPNEANAGIYIRSKFLDNFQMLGNFSGNPDPKGFKMKNSPQLKQIEGFEKVIAACLILGEVDYHGGNVGIVTDNGHYIAAKIDHGKSAAINYGDERAVREDMMDRFISFGYLVKNSMILPFDAKKLKESIDEMLNISEDEVAKLIGNRAHLLKKVGFDLGEDSVIKHITKLKNRISVMREFSRTLDLVAQSNAPENIKSGGWVTELGLRDPIEWAVLRGYKIDGIDPITWAASHQFDIVKMLYSAAEKGNTHMISALVAGTSNATALNMQDKQGNTALMLAAEKSDLKVIENLHKEIKNLSTWHLDPTIRNNEGKSALDIAKEKGDAKVIAKLTEYTKA